MPRPLESFVSLRSGLLAAQGRDAVTLAALGNPSELYSESQLKPHSYDKLFMHKNRLLIMFNLLVNMHVKLEGCMKTWIDSQNIPNT